MEFRLEREEDLKLRHRHKLSWCESCDVTVSHHVDFIVYIIHSVTTTELNSVHS